MDELALFRSFPWSSSSLDRRDFVSCPTRVETLDLREIPDGTLFVKRDDAACDLCGGNKPRKLEFSIGKALAQGARRLVTSGGLGTHHGLATTILGRNAGLETTLVLVDQPLTPAVEQTLLLHAAYGAQLVYGRHPAGAVAATMRVLAGAVVRGERPFALPPGGSSRRGNLGFVSAGLELAEQVRAGLIPEPAEIYIAVGTGGSLAGLVVGLKLAGLGSRVAGILVNDILPPSPGSLAGAARHCISELRSAGAELPEVNLTPTDFTLLRGQLGDGYGVVTPAALEALEVAGAAGLALETTYTGKCLAAILERARRGDLRGPVLFWNTYNGVDVAAKAPRPLDRHLLPVSIRARLEHRSEFDA